MKQVENRTWICFGNNVFYFLFYFYFIFIHFIGIHFSSSFVSIKDCDAASMCAGFVLLSDH